MKAVLAVPAAIVMMVAAGCGGASDRSGAIASEIGGDATCTTTGYELTSKLDNSKTPIYDCVKYGKEMCVTESGGIAHDSTVIVRLLFADALSGTKPTCLG